MSDAGENVGYNDGNRAFLQAIMARGTMTLKEGKEVLAEILSVDQGRSNVHEQVQMEAYSHTGRVIKPEDVSNDDFYGYISAAQEAVAPFDYEITTTQHQLTKTRYWAIINSNSDPTTQFATIHTPEELGFIQRMLHAMFETYNTKRRDVMAVSSMQALKKEIIKPGNQALAEGTQVADKGLTQQEAERCLGVLVSEGWFELSKESYYTLTPRALMELRSWLVSTFNDPDDEEDGQRIKNCEACKEIITTGQRCAELECPVRLHDVCQEAYWNSRKNDKCPKCKTPWVQDKHFVGQRVITKTEDYLRGRRKSGGVGRSHRAEEEEEEEHIGVERSRIASSPTGSSSTREEEEGGSEELDGGD